MKCGTCKYIYAKCEYVSNVTLHMTRQLTQLEVLNKPKSLL